MAHHIALHLLLLTIVSPILTSGSTLLTAAEVKDLALKLSTGSQVGVTPGVQQKLRELSLSSQNILGDAVENYPGLRPVADKLEDIDEHVWYVDQAYRHIAEYVSNPGQHKVAELKYIASAFPDIAGAVESIHESFCGHQDGPSPGVGVLNVLANNTDTEAKCVTNKSSVELIHKLYETVALTEVEALIVLLYTQDLQEKLENRPAQQTKDEVINSTTDRISRALENVQKALDLAAQRVSECNAAKQENNE